ncbi:MAG: hypothetical protein AMS26_06405 [Bacteroides sp. SM23_62]|nr:MAG: hypothetical protein AMS26_06405 [Bacteroides sp. SM23_62]
MMKTLDFLRFFIIVILGTVTFSGCSEKKTKMSSSAEEMPDQVIENTTMVFTIDGEKSTVIKAESVFKWLDKDLLKAKVLEVDFYDSLGEHASHLVADSGWVWEKRQYLEVMGDVLVATDEGMKLETQSLKWDPNISKIKTDDFVKITKGKDIITGYGLEAEQDLKNFKIKRLVKGKIQKKEDEEIE